VLDSAARGALARPPDQSPANPVSQEPKPVSRIWGISQYRQQSKVGPNLPPAPKTVRRMRRTSPKLPLVLVPSVGPSLPPFYPAPGRALERGFLRRAIQRPISQATKSRRAIRVTAEIPDWAISSAVASCVTTSKSTVTNNTATKARPVRKRILARLPGFFPPLRLYLQSSIAPKIPRTSATKGTGLDGGTVV
jgi:hypothetical protein